MSDESLVKNNFHKIKVKTSELKIPYSIPYSIILKNSIYKNSNILELQNTVLRILPIITYNTKFPTNMNINRKKIFNDLIRFGPDKSFTRDALINVINPLFCLYLGNSDLNNLKILVRTIKNLFDYPSIREQTVNGYLIAVILNRILKSKTIECKKKLKDGVIVYIGNNKDVYNIAIDRNNIVYSYKSIDNIDYIVYFPRN